MSESKIEDARLDLSWSGATVSEATLLPEHLVPAFADVLREIYPQDADAIEAQFAYLRKQADSDNLPSTEQADLAEQVGWLIEKLFDKLDAIAPEGHYFGAIEGDGSCFGFWGIEADDD